MANEKPEEILKANAGAPTANIPDLKQKDKERKKGGAAWSGVRGAAGEFSGATGGAARAAASAAAGAAGGAGAAAGTGAFAAAAQFLATLTSTALGQALAAAAALLLVGGAGLAGYSLLKGGAGGAGAAGPNLGGIADTIKVHSGGSDRVAVASKGEVRFDPETPAKPAAGASAAAPAAAASDAGGVPQAPPAPAAPPAGLAQGLEGAKLSSSLGGSFGGKNIFSGNSSAPKFGAIKRLPEDGGKKGQLSGMQDKVASASGSRHSVSKVTSSRAFGQLRMAKGMSVAASQSSRETASAAALGAFDQQQSQAGNIATSGAPGGDTVAPLSSPDTSGGGGGGGNPSMSGVGDPSLNSMMSQISALADKGQSDMSSGKTLMIIGAILVAIGIALECIPFVGWGWGAALIAAGTIMGIKGYMQYQQGQQEMQAAQTLGTALANEQQDAALQSQSVAYCTNWVQQTGGKMANCVPPQAGTAQAKLGSGASQSTIDGINTEANSTPAVIK